MNPPPNHALPAIRVHHVTSKLHVLSPPFADDGKAEDIEAMKAMFGMTAEADGRVTGTMTTIALTKHARTFRIEAMIEVTVPASIEDFDKDVRETLIGHLKLETRRAALAEQLPEPRFD